MINPSLAGAIPNDSWITKDDYPDPEVLPEARDDIAYLTTVGRVLKVGELAYEDKEKFLGGAWCRVGDYVCYQKLTGTKFVYKGVKLLLLFDDQVIMKVDNPEDLDTTLVLGG
jgi:co-chaperonin GroES (HSP10)